MSAADRVIWHDAECGGYEADLPLWRELAGTAGGAVLDVGAGTGRVAVDLARRGHEVTALDRDPALLAELRRRAAELPIAAVEADARLFHLGRQFALIVVPMQTVQLFGGTNERVSFLRSAAEHMAPGARLAAALADPLDGFDAEHTEPPAPDVRRIGEITYASQPVAVRDEGDTLVIERLRHTISAGGARDVQADAVRLARLAPARLEREGRKVGLLPERRRRIPATDEHVGSTVVMLRVR
jgi:SAM-dependent methyltransferase